MLYKAIPITPIKNSHQTATSVEIFEVQHSIPAGSIRPSNDFRRALEQSPTDVREAYREVIKR